MGQVTELWLSCYLVLLSIDSKTRQQEATPPWPWPDPYTVQMWHTYYYMDTFSNTGNQFLHSHIKKQEYKHIWSFGNTLTHCGQVMHQSTRTALAGFPQKSHKKFHDFSMTPPGQNPNFQTKKISFFFFFAALVSISITERHRRTRSRRYFREKYAFNWWYHLY